MLIIYLKDPNEDITWQASSGMLVSIKLINLCKHKSYESTISIKNFDELLQVKVGKRNNIWYIGKIFWFQSIKY